MPIERTERFVYTKTKRTTALYLEVIRQGEAPMTDNGKIHIPLYVFGNSSIPKEMELTFKWDETD